MVTYAPYRAAMAHAREAVITHRLRGGPEPVNPHKPTTARARYWNWGVEQAERVVAKLLEIGG
jgi:hypothetical protein